VVEVSTDTSVLTEQRGGVLLVTLNRPDRMNAMTPAMREHVMDAIDEANSTDSIRVVVVTGAGRGFCAGADVSGGASSFTAGRGEGEYRDGGGLLAMRIFASHKPVIGAVNGAAVGMGAGMLLPMDMRIASQSARFGFVYTRRGIAPESVSSWFLPRLVGVSTALEWMITGRVFDAPEALAGGLVSRVVGDDELLDVALAIAREIAENTAPASVAATRQMVWEHLSTTPEAAFRVESRVVSALSSLPDAAEGVASFRERRRPRFTGHLADYLPGAYPWPEITE
jgi:enoyl-CoA hydratase/carnithine racemase